MFPIPWSLCSHGKCPPVSINSHNTCLWLFGVSPSILIVWKPRSPSNIYIYILFIHICLIAFQYSEGRWQHGWPTIPNFPCCLWCIFSVMINIYKHISVPNQHQKYTNIFKKMITRFLPNVFRLPLFNPLIPQGIGTGTDQFSLHTPRNTWCGPGLHASTQTCAWWLAWHVDLAGKVFGQTALTQKANEY